jgi:hypothetical protein
MPKRSAGFCDKRIEEDQIVNDEGNLVPPRPHNSEPQQMALSRAEF